MQSTRKVFADSYFPLPTILAFSCGNITRTNVSSASVNHAISSLHQRLYLLVYSLSLTTTVRSAESSNPLHVTPPIARSINCEDAVILLIIYRLSLDRPNISYITRHHSCLYQCSQLFQRLMNGTISCNGAPLMISWISTHQQHQSEAQHHDGLYSFQKQHTFKMADGRHFENHFITLSQPRIIQFRSNLARRCKIQFRRWTIHKNIEILKIQDGGRPPL